MSLKESNEAKDIPKTSVSRKTVELVQPGFVQCPGKVQAKNQKWQGTITAFNFLAAKINSNNNKLEGICNNLRILIVKRRQWLTLTGISEVASDKIHHLDVAKVENWGGALFRSVSPS